MQNRIFSAISIYTYILKSVIIYIRKLNFERLALFILLFLLPAHLSIADVIFITNKTTSQDGHVYDASGGTGPGTGADTALDDIRVGEGTTAQNRVYYGLIGFNVNAIAGSTVTAATLYINYEGFSGTQSDICSLLHFDGGDFGSTIEASDFENFTVYQNDFATLSTSGVAGWRRIDVTTAVNYAANNAKAWTLNSSSYWVQFRIRPDCHKLDDSTGDYQRINSYDNGSLYPYLVVYYTPPSGTEININLNKTETYNLHRAENDIPVLSVEITDTNASHTFTCFKIKNAGTAQNTDITEVKLWADAGTIGVLDNDSLIATLYWNNTYGGWTNGNLNVNVTNYIVTVSVSASAVFNRTFQAKIPVGGIICSGGATNESSVSNSQAQTIISNFGSGDVVINEIMWMGSSYSNNSYDEWVELRNMTGLDINFFATPFSIYRGDGTKFVTIDHGILEAGGYFLIANKSPSDPKCALAVNPDIVKGAGVTIPNSPNCQLILYNTLDNSGTVIDTAGDNSANWLAGDNTNPPRKAMVRKEDPGDGTVGANWYTATNQIGWKTDATNDYGTPGLANIPDLTPPAAITNLTAATTNTNGGVVLHWTAPGDDGWSGTVSGYIVRYSFFPINTTNDWDNAYNYDGAGQWYNFVPGGSDETRIVAYLPARTAYYFSVRAYDEGGNLSPLGNSAMATTWYDYEAPAAITNLKVISNYGAGQIAITFTAPGDDGWRGTANHYIVKWSTNAINNDTDFSNANTYAQSWTPPVGGSDEMYVMSGLPGNKIIYVAIKVVDEAGNTSGLSNPASGKAGETDPPIILSATAADDSGGGIGIQAGDTVTIIFNESTGAPVINAANIDTVLQLSSGHTWLDGTGSISNAYWTTTTYSNDTLVIVLSTNGGAPTVAVGDTVTADGITISDIMGNACSDSTNITGTFGADINPPTFVSAIAYDTGGAAGLNPGDSVVIQFSETMDTNTLATIISNIDSVLRLAGGTHSWGQVDAQWSSTTYPYDTLTITITNTNGATIAIGDNIDNNKADTLQDDGPSFNDVTGNITLTGTFGGDTTGPAMVSAIANDASGGGPGIQAGDQVIITFDEETTGYPITAANINSVLQLSGGHSWLDGSGNIGSAVWTTNIYPNDTLIITLSDAVSAPTVAVGDVITIAANTIEDLAGNDATGGTITGSFGDNGYGSCSVTPNSVSAGSVNMLRFTITGETGYVITTNTIEIDTNWSWTGDPADITNYGPGYNVTGCTLYIITNAPGKYTIKVVGAQITPTASGYIEIYNMTAPTVPQTTYFYTKTATSNTTLQYISTQPYVIVTAPANWWNAYFNKSPYRDDLPAILVNKINEAKYKIDACIYRLSVSSVKNALKAAADRGVEIRIITESDNFGDISALDGYAGKIRVIDETWGSPDSTGSWHMHNKFWIFDFGYPGDDSTVEDVVWSGSYNVTVQAGTTDDNYQANNVIEIKDHTLASNFWVEFNEMWGSSTLTPNNANAKFSTSKIDNTQHIFSIGGVASNVELYFSPDDGVKAKIIDAMNTANYNIYFCIFTFTDDDIGNLMISKYNSGIKVQGVFDAQQSGISGSEYDKLRNAIGTNNIHNKKYGFTTLLHHKYMIIDVGHPESDPIVIVGSYNWTSSAENNNDENCLIIHDANVTSKFYQEFLKRFGVVQIVPATATISTVPSFIIRNSVGNQITITITHDGTVNDVITNVKVVVPSTWPSIVNNGNTTAIRGDGYNYSANGQVIFTPVAGGTEIQIINAGIQPSGTANKVTITIDNMTAPATAGPSSFYTYVSTANVQDGQVSPTPKVMVKKCALIITEVAFQGGGGDPPFDSADWVEVYCADDGNNGDGVDLNGFYFTTEDGGPIKTISSATLHTGKYAVLLFNNSTPDETTDGGAVLNLYTTAAGLTGTDEQIDIYDDTGMLLDAVCWANQNGSWTTGEDSDVQYIAGKNEWVLATGTPQESDCVDSSVVGAGVSICRLFGGSVGPAGYLDSNKKSDWAIDTSPTPGQDNSATGGGGTANPGDVVINEIMYDPATSDTYCEWIELYNTRPYDIDLSGWKYIIDGNTNTISSGTISGNGYFVIVARLTNTTGDSFEKDFGNGNNNWGDDATYEVYTPYVKGTSLGIVNTGTTIIINDGANDIDSVTFDPAWGGAPLSGITNVSLERKDPFAPSNDGNNWGSCVTRWTPYQPHQGTPGSQNSLAGGNNKYICINEVYFEDNDYPDRDEWIEIYNSSASANVSLAGWTLTDYDGNVYTFPIGCVIPPQKFLVVHFNQGTDDLDFTDGKGDVFTGDTTDILDDNDELGLYSGATRNSTTIVDFVAWSSNGTIVDTTADNDAVAASNKNYAYWQDNQAVDVDSNPDLNLGRTIYLIQDGVSTNGVFDWAFSSSTNARFFFSEGYSNISSDTNVQKNISNLSIYSSQSDPSGDTVRIGEQFYIRLTTSSDPSPGQKTVTTVRVTSSSNDKINGIVVTLVETGANTGIFEGWVKVDAGESNDPLQWIKAGTLEIIKVWWSGDENYFDTIQVAGSSAEDIVINEFVPNPKGTPDNGVTNSHMDDEWIEIYNRGIISHNLGNWTIRFDNGKSYRIPTTVDGNSTVLAPGGYLYVHFEDEPDASPTTGAGNRDDTYANGGKEIHIFEAKTVYSNNVLNADYGWGGGIALYSSTNNSINYLIDYVRYASPGTGSYTHYNRAITKGIWTEGDYVDTSGRKDIKNQFTGSGDSFYPSYGRKQDGVDTDKGSDWHWAIKTRYRTDNGGDPARWPLYGGQATSTNNMDYTPPPDVQITEIYDTPNDRGGAITVKWLPVDDAWQGYSQGIWGYAIFYSAGGPFNDCRNAVFYPDSPIKNSTVCSCNVQGLEDGQQYWFAVVAIDSNNNFDLLTQSSLSGVTPINNLGIGNIVFNEIQYKPKSGSAYYKREFIELYNRGTNTVDLAGWYLVDPTYGDKYYICPATPLGETDTTLAPGGYAIILGKTTEVNTQSEMSPLGPNSTNARWFFLRRQNTTFEWVTNTGCGPGKYGQWSTETLNNDWETIELYDAVGNLIDVVTYGQNWSTVGYAQSGGSMSKLDPDLPSTDPDSWGESYHTTQSNGTPCRPNSPNEPPMCEILFPNAYIWFGSNVTITVHAEETNALDKSTYNDEIDIIQLQYSLNSTTGLDGDWFDIGPGIYDIANGTNVTFTTNWTPTEPQNETDDLVWIRARARDTRFRYSEWTTIQLEVRIKIDNQAPTYTNWVIENMTQDSSDFDDCTVQVDISDNNGTGLSGTPQIKYYYVNRNGVTNWGTGLWEDMYFVNGHWYFDIPSPGWASYAGGYIYFNVRAQDVIGNQSISPLMSEYIDLSADHIELTYTDGIAPVNGTEIVNIQVKDVYGTNVAKVVLVTNKVSGNAKIIATTLSNAVFNASSNVVYGYTKADGSATITVFDSVQETVIITPNSSLIGSSAVPDRDVGCQVVFKCGPLDHFVIIHDGNAWVNMDEQIVVQAIDTYGNIKTDFDGTVTLNCAGMASGEIVWSTNSSATGSFTDGGAGSEYAYYTFNTSWSDRGVVTLFIQSDTVDTVDVTALSEGKYDNDSEGLLYFRGYYPPLYVTSIRLFDDITYINDITNAPGGTVIFIQAIGYDQSPTTRDRMFVTVTSSTSDTTGITVELIETGINTSEFRGYVTLKDISDEENKYIAARYPGEIVTVTSTITNLSGGYEYDTVTVINTEPTSVDSIRFVQSDYFLDLNTINLFGTAYIRLDAPLSAANPYTIDYTFGVITSLKNTTGFTLKIVETGPNTGEYRASVIAGTNTDSLVVPPIIGCFSTGDTIKIMSTVDTSMTDICYVTNTPIAPSAITNIYFMHNSSYSIEVNGNPLVGGSRVYIKAMTALSNDGNPLYQDYVPVVISSSATTPGGITVWLYETGLNTGVYTNWVDIGATSSGAYQRIGANTVGETIKVMDTVSSNTDTFVIANTPLGLIDDFDDGADPNEADGNITDLNGGTHSYNNTIRDYSPIVTNGYCLQVNFNAANDGISLYISGFNASPYAQISFAKKGVTGSEDIGIRLKDREGNTAVQTINNIGTVWSTSTYNIPADFAGVSINNLYSIEFYATAGSGTFYIDDVQFINPNPISSVTIYSSDYTTDMTNARVGDQIYIELVGIVTNTNTIDNTVVVLRSDSDSTNGIRVLLTETARNSGIYRGVATIAPTTSDPADQIEAHAGDYVYVIASGNTSATDKVYILPNPIDHFEIVHDGNGAVGLPEQIVVYACDIYNDIVFDYTGTISLYVIGETGEISWDTNSSASGTFIDGGVGVDWAKYTFALSDNGVVTLFITDDTAESVDPECISIVGSYTDNDVSPQWLNFTGGVGQLSITKSISNVSLNGSTIDPVPGATVNYIITYSNMNAFLLNNAIIYDQIPYSNAVYKSNSDGGSATGWTVEWSTNTNPDQSWNSADYTNVEPVSSKIKWIRWIKASIPANEKATLKYEVIIK